MGAIALTCATVDDETAWCLLALVVSIVQAHAAGALATIGMALVFITAMIFRSAGPPARLAAPRDSEARRRSFHFALNH